MKKFKMFLAIIVALGLLVASVLVFAFSSSERQIMILGSKDFKVDDMDQYDLDKKVIYAGETGIKETDPWLPRAVNEEVTIHAAPGLDEDGVVYAYLSMSRDVYSEDPFAGGGAPRKIDAEGKYERVPVDLGGRVEFEGYTIRFVGAHIAKNGPHYAALVLEKIPANVTVFPSGNSDVW